MSVEKALVYGAHGTHVIEDDSNDTFNPYGIDPVGNNIQENFQLGYPGCNQKSAYNEEDKRKILAFNNALKNINDIMVKMDIKI